MVDDFGGTDSDQGTYGPVGPTSGSEPAPVQNQGSAGPTGPVGPAGPAGPPGDGVVGARIQFIDPTHISLQQYQGQTVVVNGESVLVPSSGFSRSSADNTISATGDDSGSAAAINTFYYVYVSNSQATFSPSSIRLSTTPPSLLGGVEYLGLSGNAANWRLMGWVSTISNAGTPNFADSPAQRLVINRYNKRALRMFTCPGYVDDNAQTVLTLPASATWTQYSTGQLEYIDNGEDAAQFRFNAFADFQFPATDAFNIGIGDNAVSAIVAEDQNTYDSATGADAAGSLDVPAVFPPGAVAKRTAFMSYYTTGAGNIFTRVDDARNGAPADPPISFMDGIVYG